MRSWFNGAFSIWISGNQLKVFLFSIFFVWFNDNFAQTTSQIDSLNSISHQDLLQNLALSKSKLQTNIKLAEKIGYQRGIAVANQKLAIVHYYLQETDQGMACSVKAANYFEGKSDFNELANIYADIGFTIRTINPMQAKNYFQLAINLAETHQLTAAKEKIYNNYGTLFFEAGQVDSALHYHTKSYTISKENNFVQAIPYSLNNLAVDYSAQKKFARAMEILDESDAYRKQENNDLNWADNLAYRADVYYDMEKFDSALVYYQKSLALAKKTNFTNLIKFCLGRISNCYEKTKDITQALNYLRQAQRFTDSIQSVEKSIAVAQLQVAYDAAKKDKEIAENKQQIQAAEILAARQNSRLTKLIIGIIVAIALIVFIYSYQKSKRRKLEQEIILEKSTAENKIHKEKLRIARDLHDNIGSQLTYVISSLDNLNYVQNNELKTERLNQLGQFTRNTMNELRETIWTIQAEEVPLSEFCTKVAQLIQPFKSNYPSTQISLKSTTSSGILTSIQAVNCFRTIQEAINNALKYAQPSQLDIVITDNSITISDNGIGFNKKLNPSGKGLQNMQTRIQEIGFTFALTSTIGEGTQVQIGWGKT